MKAVVIQPPYSKNLEDADSFFNYKLNELDKCDESVDIIVLPEYSEVPVATSTREETLALHDRYIEPLLAKSIETAKRCNAIVFVNALSQEPTGYRNTTYCYDRKGVLVGKYFKKHLPPLEQEVLKLDSAYTYEPSEPYVLEIEGLRYGFLTCYDFYFYEAFARIAQEDVDIIIGCSLQRSDTHSATEIMCRNLAYNTNAYVLRSSVSFAEDSKVCGASMVVAPNGDILANMEGRFGSVAVAFDPKVKYLKPAGFGNPPAPHYKYIEYGRKPWQYRNGGSAMIAPDLYLPYPRVCAHRGFSCIAPENSMPAFGAAIALGAEEIEFDLWATADGEIVSCHDQTLDRVSDGHGKITDKTLEELKGIDFGSKFGESFKGLPVVLFEDILKKFAGQVIMNVHVKTISDEYDQKAMERIVALIRKYECAPYVYFMIVHDGVIRQFLDYAPDIRMCVGHDTKRPWEIVDRAIALKAHKVQLYKPFFDQKMIDKAHEHGIICNVFWADDPSEAVTYSRMGIDTILTNNFNNVAQALRGK